MNWWRMNEWLPALAGLLSMLTGGGFVALWLNLGGRIAKAEARADAAEIVAAKAVATHDVLMRDVNDYRVEQAEKIARIKTLVEVQVMGLSDAEKRMAKAIDDMGGRFDAMSGRLDTFAERIIGVLTSRETNHRD